MKIVLSMFDSMQSKVMEVPEDIGLKYEMVLTQPIQVAVDGTNIRNMRPFDTICTFEWSGFYDDNGLWVREPISKYNYDENKTRNQNGLPMVYKLVDIRKL